jgi:hypothetical protein
VRELDEVLGPAADVGPDVEQEDGTTTRDRNGQGERGAVDPAVALEVEQAGGQSRTGRAAGHERVGAAVGHRLGRLDDRGFGRRANGEGRVGRLGDGDGRIDDLNTIRDRADLRLRPEQDHADPALSSLGSAGCDFRGPAIRPAGIHGDRDHRPRGQESDSPASGATTSRPL